MKRITTLLLSLCILVFGSMTSHAQPLSVGDEGGESVISVCVPDSHTVTIVQEEGRIVIDGTVAGGTAEIARHKEQSYRIVPDAGRQLERILYNGEDVTTQVKKGVFTAPKLVNDALLEVFYSDATVRPTDDKTPVTGDGVRTAGLWILLLAVAGGMSCIPMIKKRKC